MRLSKVTSQPPFQSTPLCEGRLIYTLKQRGWVIVSIHAPV